MKIIIGLIGSIASGKGTVAKYLKEKYQAETFKFSKILRDMLKRAYLDQNRDNLIKISLALREAFGQDILAKIISRELDFINDKRKFLTNKVMEEALYKIDDASEIIFLACSLDFPAGGLRGGGG